MSTVTSSLFRQVVDPANRANPYPLYAELRRTPVSLQDDGTYVVSTYRETGQLLRDPRISSDRRNWRERPTMLRGTLLEQQPSFLSLDPPAHDQGRRRLMTHFGPPHTPGRVEGMRGTIEAIVTDLIDRQIGKRRIDLCDVVSGQRSQPIAAIIDGSPGPDGAFLRCAHVQFSSNPGRRSDHKSVPLSSVRC